MDRSGWARRIPIRNGGPCRGHVALLSFLSLHLSISSRVTSFIRGVSHDQVYLPQPFRSNTQPFRVLPATRVCTYASVQHTRTHTPVDRQITATRDRLSCRLSLNIRPRRVAGHVPPRVFTSLPRCTRARQPVHSLRWSSRNFSICLRLRVTHRSLLEIATSLHVQRGGCPVKPFRIS